MPQEGYAEVPEMMTGFESTYIHGHGKDIMDLTGHTENFIKDLELAWDAGVRTIRYPIRWHKIERERGVFDWAYTDKVMARICAMGFKVILDPLHHVSIPDWLSDGFGNPEFPRLYLNFVREGLLRYQWVYGLTPFNEPYATIYHCAHEGNWYPHWNERDDPNGFNPYLFLLMLANGAKAIVMVVEMVRKEFPRIKIIYNDSCEKHYAPGARDYERELNHRRFAMLDLLQRDIRDNLYWVLKLAEIQRKIPLNERLKLLRLCDWVQDHPIKIDMLGLDYYFHHEHSYTETDVIPAGPYSKGLAHVAADYHKRYALPMFVAEFNGRGTVADLQTMLAMALSEYQKAQEAGLSLNGFCWFSFIDACAWGEGKLATEVCLRKDPTGIFWRDGDERIASELSETFTKLAKKRMRVEDIRIYNFLPPLGPNPETGEPGTMARFVEIAKNDHPEWIWHDQTPPEPITVERRRARAA